MKNDMLTEYNKNKKKMAKDFEKMLDKQYASHTPARQLGFLRTKLQAWEHKVDEAEYALAVAKDTVAVLKQMIAKREVPQKKVKKATPKTFTLTIGEGGNNEGMTDYESLKDLNNFLKTILTADQIKHLHKNKSGWYGPYHMELEEF